MQHPHERYDAEDDRAYQPDGGRIWPWRGRCSCLSRRNRQLRDARVEFQELLGLTLNLGEDH